MTHQHTTIPSLVYNMVGTILNGSVPRKKKRTNEKVFNKPVAKFYIKRLPISPVYSSFAKLICHAIHYCSQPKCIHVQSETALIYFSICNRTDTHTRTKQTKFAERSSDFVLSFIVMPCKDHTSLYLYQFHIGFQSVWKNVFSLLRDFGSFGPRIE